jgi:hypothetical protein
MRTWARATHELRCGGLHDQLTTIPIGAPVLVIRPTLTRTLYRCAACAGEPVPELPELPDVPRPDIPSTNRLPAPMVRPTVAALTKLLPFDFKAAQAGRED